MKRQLIVSLEILGFLFVTASNEAVAGNAKSGQGTATVSPNVVLSGSTNNFTFSVRAPAGKNTSYNSGSQATLLVPNNWTAPQTNNPSSAGYVSVSPVLSQSTVSIASIAGSGPWTITINFATSQRSGGFDLSYGKVTAPTNETVYTFTTKTKQSNGTLTSMKSGSPAVTVNSLNKYSTTTTVVSSTNVYVYGQAITFTATVTSTNSATPSGTITFLDADVLIGTATLNGSGQATLSTNGFDVINTPHFITAEYSGSSNFNGSISGSLQEDINPATLTVSGQIVNNKIYDGTTDASLDTNGATLVGVIGGDSVTLDASIATASFADKNVGSGKTVTVSGLDLAGDDAPNYTLTQPAATANIIAAVLTVTADSTNRLFGAIDPAFTASYSGFVGGDTSAVLAGSPAFSTTANLTSSVGGSPYLIVVTNGTLSTANYTFAFVNGQLTINPASSTPATLSLVKLADGSMKISAAGSSNAAYLVQATTNFVSWSTLSTNTADINGAFTFTDVNATQFKSRFYRAAKP
jgi:hypothetical protein